MIDTYITFEPYDIRPVAKILGENILPSAKNTVKLNRMATAQTSFLTSPSHKGRVYYAKSRETVDMSVWNK